MTASERLDAIVGQFAAPTDGPWVYNLIAALRAVLAIHRPDPEKHALDSWEKGARAALIEVEAAITAALDVTS